MAEANNSESKPQKPAAKPAASKPPAKKAKPPAPEDKPFQEFMEQDFTPSLKKALTDEGIDDIELNFTKQKIPIAGISNEDYWQVIGSWQKGQRQFNLYFFEENIKGEKGFSHSNNGFKPSTLESFMIDERKATLDLMVMYVLQRLNGQKWLNKN